MYPLPSFLLTVDWLYIKTIASIWRGNMLWYLFADIICSEKRIVFWERHYFSSCLAGHLRPFRYAFTHPCLSQTLLRPPHCHPITFHSLCLHSFPRSFLTCPVFFCLREPRSEKFWRRYFRLSTEHVGAISISVCLLSSQTVAAYWFACTFPHLRFDLARKLSVSFSCTSCSCDSPHPHTVWWPLYISVENELLYSCTLMISIGVVLWQKHSLQGPVFVCHLPPCHLSYLTLRRGECR